MPTADNSCAARTRFLQNRTIQSGYFPAVLSKGASIQTMADTGSIAYTLQESPERTTVVPCGCATTLPVLEYTVACDPTGILSFLTSTPNGGPFTFTASSLGVGNIVFRFFSDQYISQIGYRLVNLPYENTITPVPGTASIGYTFFCSPIIILISGTPSGVLEPTFSYAYQNMSGADMFLTLTPASGVPRVLRIASGVVNTYSPDPIYGWVSYSAV